MNVVQSCRISPKSSYLKNHDISTLWQALAAQLCVSCPGPQAASPASEGSAATGAAVGRRRQVRVPVLRLWCSARRCALCRAGALPGPRQEQPSRSSSTVRPATSVRRPRTIRRPSDGSTRPLRHEPPRPARDPELRPDTGAQSACFLAGVRPVAVTAGTAGWAVRRRPRVEPAGPPRDGCRSVPGVLSRFPAQWPASRRPRPSLAH